MRGYKYHCRSGYGSDKLLIEFTSGVERNSFGKDLLQALKEINPKISEQTDLWMNDEVLYGLDSDAGHFTLSIDSWNLAFILSNDNQTCISTIDNILKRDKRFEKVEA